MKTLLPTVTLSALMLALAGGTALGQPVAQTPLSEPVQTSGSLTPTQRSSCGFVADSATQVLQVNQDFASVNIAATGDRGLTLMIQGPNGFSECHTTSGNNGSISAPGLLNRGDYSFFVGNTSQTATSYTLTISEN